MADLIIAEYAVKPVGWKEFEAQVETVTGETKKLQTQIQSTFSDKSIEEATDKLDKHGNKVEEVTKQYASAKAELKALTSDITSGKLEGKDLDKAIARAAELTDHIGDVRNEIRKLSSDTKVFDTMVQGARGIAAAFSVATGLAATFGNQNKDLEKALLKVQGAMAALQGVQELAKIATEKGGIVTNGYNAALKTAKFLQDELKISALAAWGAITAGVGLAVLAIVELIDYFSDADDAAAKFEAKREQQAQEEAKRQVSIKEEQLKKLSEADKEFFAQQEIVRRQRLAAGEAERQVEFDLLSQSIEKYQNKVKGYQTGYYDYLGLTAEEEKSRIAQFNDYINTALIARNKIVDETNKEAQKNQESAAKALGDLMKKQIAEANAMEKALREGLFMTDPLAYFKEKYNKERTDVDQPLITEKSVEDNKANADAMAKHFADLYNNAIKAQQEYNAARIRMEQETVSNIQNISSSLFGFVSGIYEVQAQENDARKEEELRKAGDDAEKRKKIEQKFAIEQAKIRRQQAIVEKTQAIFNIGVTLAQGIQKITAEAAALAATPATAALSANAYAQLGILIAASAFQIATVAAKPLPEIPKFEKGGAVVLAGGRMNDGHLFGRSHREGGILINAQGGEYIWDRETTQRHSDIIKAAHENRIEDLVLHKYVVPMMQKQSSSNAAGEIYDDWLLRAEIKRSRAADKQNAEYIAKHVSRVVTDSLYFQTRYR